jgi:hypothetical protein
MKENVLLSKARGELTARKSIQAILNYALYIYDNIEIKIRNSILETQSFNIQEEFLVLLSLHQ